MQQGREKVPHAWERIAGHGLAYSSLQINRWYLRIYQRIKREGVPTSVNERLPNAAPTRSQTRPQPNSMRRRAEADGTVLASNKEQHAVSESTRVSPRTSVADEVHRHKAECRTSHAQTDTCQGQNQTSFTADEISDFRPLVWGKSRRCVLQ